jgi:hypothetical protein
MSIKMFKNGIKIKHSMFMHYTDSRRLSDTSMQQDAEI